MLNSRSSIVREISNGVSNILPTGSSTQLLLAAGGLATIAGVGYLTYSAIYPSWKEWKDKESDGGKLNYIKQEATNIIKKVDEDIELENKGYHSTLSTAFTELLKESKALDNKDNNSDEGKRIVAEKLTPVNFSSKRSLKLWDNAKIKELGNASGTLINYAQNHKKGEKFEERLHVIKFIEDACRAIEKSWETHPKEAIEKIEALIVFIGFAKSSDKISKPQSKFIEQAQIAWKGKGRQKVKFREALSKTEKHLKRAIVTITTKKAEEEANKRFKSIAENANGLISSMKTLLGETYLTEALPDPLQPNDEYLSDTFLTASLHQLIGVDFEDSQIVTPTVEKWLPKLAGNHSRPISRKKMDNTQPYDSSNFIENIDNLELRTDGRIYYKNSKDSKEGSIPSGFAKHIYDNNTKIEGRDTKQHAQFCLENYKDALELMQALQMIHDLYELLHQIAEKHGTDNAYTILNAFNIYVDEMNKTILNRLGELEGNFTHIHTANDSYYLYNTKQLGVLSEAKRTTSAIRRSITQNTEEIEKLEKHKNKILDEIRSGKRSLSESTGRFIQRVEDTLQNKTMGKLLGAQANTILEEITQIKKVAEKQAEIIDRATLQTQLAGKPLSGNLSKKKKEKLITNSNTSSVTTTSTNRSENHDAKSILESKVTASPSSSPPSSPGTVEESDPEGRASPQEKYNNSLNLTNNKNPLASSTLTIEETISTNTAVTNNNDNKMIMPSSNIFSSSAIIPKRKEPITNTTNPFASHNDNKNLSASFANSTLTIEETTIPNTPVTENNDNKMTMHPSKVFFSSAIILKRKELKINTNNNPFASSTEINSDMDMKYSDHQETWLDNQTELDNVKGLIGYKAKNNITLGSINKFLKDEKKLNDSEIKIQTPSDDVLKKISNANGFLAKLRWFFFGNPNVDLAQVAGIMALRAKIKAMKGDLPPSDTTEKKISTIIKADKKQEPENLLQSNKNSIIIKETNPDPKEPESHTPYLAYKEGQKPIRILLSNSTILHKNNKLTEKEIQQINAVYDRTCTVTKKIEELQPLLDQQKSWFYWIWGWSTKIDLLKEEARKEFDLTLASKEEKLWKLDNYLEDFKGLSSDTTVRFDLQYIQEISDYLKAMSSSKDKDIQAKVKLLTASLNIAINSSEFKLYQEIKPMIYELSPYYDSQIAPLIFINEQKEEKKKDLFTSSEANFSGSTTQTSKKLAPQTREQNIPDLANQVEEAILYYNKMQVTLSSTYNQIVNIFSPLTVNFTKTINDATNSINILNQFYISIKKYVQPLLKSDEEKTTITSKMLEEKSHSFSDVKNKLTDIAEITIQNLSKDSGQNVSKIEKKKNGNSIFQQLPEKLRYVITPFYKKAKELKKFYKNAADLLKNIEEFKAEQEKNSTKDIFVTQSKLRFFKKLAQEQELNATNNLSRDLQAQALRVMKVINDVINTINKNLESELKKPLIESTLPIPKLLPPAKPTTDEKDEKNEELTLKKVEEIKNFIKNNIEQVYFKKIDSSQSKSILDLCENTLSKICTRKKSENASSIIDTLALTFVSNHSGNKLKLFHGEDKAHAYQLASWLYILHGEAHEPNIEKRVHLVNNYANSEKTKFQKEDGSIFTSLSEQTKKYYETLEKAHQITLSRKQDPIDRDNNKPNRYTDINQYSRNRW